MTASKQQLRKSIKNMTFPATKVVKSRIPIFLPLSGSDVVVFQFSHFFSLIVVSHHCLLLYTRLFCSHLLPPVNGKKCYTRSVVSISYISSDPYPYFASLFRILHPMLFPPFGVRTIAQNTVTIASKYEYPACLKGPIVNTAYFPFTQTESQTPTVTRVGSSNS